VKLEWVKGGLTFTEGRRLNGGKTTILYGAAIAELRRKEG
jgi:hypothetical protein